MTSANEPALRQPAPPPRPALAALVLQSALDQLSGGFVHHGDLLIACVKIATYNQHCSAPYLPSLGRPTSYQVYSGGGADDAI
jgi:hypothetical protein